MIFFRFINILYRRVFLDISEKKLINQLVRLGSLDNFIVDNGNGDKISIIVQMTEDYFFLVKFYIFYLSLKRKYKEVDVKLVSLTDPLLRRGRSSIIKRMDIFDWKWSRIYRKLFDAEIIFKFNDYVSPPSKNQMNISFIYFSNLQSKSDVLALQYKSYKIGNLIYDYFLRVENVPTVDIKSPVLQKIITNAIRAVDFFEEEFKKKKYHYLLTSYVTYVVHGIPALIAENNNTKVIYFSVLNDVFCKRLSGNVFSHVKDYTLYSELKGLISRQDILQAEQKLKERFLGKIDSNISYMRRSAYGNSGEGSIEKYDKPVVVIFLHCFFDSPHIYRWMLFPDFYEWLDFTLSTLNENKNIKVVIKRHPNAIEGNENIVSGFLKKFPDVVALDSSINNLAIVNDLKPLLVLTVYGTVAYEMGYLGVPVYCAGDNPHIDFAFQKTFDSQVLYRDKLLDVHNLKSLSRHDLDLNKSEAIRFYHLHSNVNTEKCYGVVCDKGQGILKKLFYDGELSDFVDQFHLININNIFLSIERDLDHDL